MDIPDYILFPVNNVFELAEVLINLSDEGFKTLQHTLESDYGRHIEITPIHEN